MTKSCDALHKQINAELRAGNAGVSVGRKGDRLYLQATLSPKPWGTSAKARTGKPYQQRIYLGVLANPAGYKRAKAEALRLSSDLAMGQFNWLDWQDDPTGRSQTRTAKEWIEAFKKEYFDRAIKYEGRDPNGVALTWDKDYWSQLKKLNPNAQLTAEAMEAIVLGYGAHQRSRRRAAMVIGKLARFAGIEIDLEGKRGHYSIQQAQLRDLPTDERIVEVYYSLADNPPWQWAFGMMAVYGIRPGESWLCDLSRFVKGEPRLFVKSEKQRVPEELKKYREIWPYPREWWESWRLWEGEPPYSKRRPSYLCSQFFKRRGIEFKPYDLRHRWAVRNLEMGGDIVLAAKQMGHSVTEHNRTYLNWIQAETYRRDWERSHNKNN